MSHRLRLTSEKVEKRLALIAKKLAKDKRPIAPFKLEYLPDARADADLSIGYDDAPGKLLDWDSHWGGQDRHFVLRSQFVVPKGWHEPTLHLPLGVTGDIFTHPEALLYIDGVPLASADRYHHTIDLPENVVDGFAHELLLHGWTGLTGWPPDPEDHSQLFLRTCNVVEQDRGLEAFLVLARTAQDVAGKLHDNRPEKHGILSALDAAFLTLDTRDPMDTAFRASIAPAMAQLQAGLDAAGAPLDVQLHAIGHAHMDVAYLWPIEQIRRKNARTYSNVLRLMEKHENYIFSHTQPQLYAWTQEDYPDLFDGIRERVKEGRWEMLGGMWVEPDANMPGPEALVRQIMLARQWCEEELGEGSETPVLWLPDTFGFPGCLPQLMVQAGLKWFVTNKVNWNQYNQMPASTTRWRGIDGSTVLAQFLTTPRDVQHLPFPTNYKSDLTAAEVIGTWTKSTVKDRVRDLIICYGYGDGGGGPTDDLIQRAQVYQSMPGAPQVKPGTVRGYFETIEKQAASLPCWQGEFYLEGHRGVLTSQGWIKRANRKAEVLLHDVEFAQSLALLAGHVPTDLTATWQLLCTNQFHDILTGTSIARVFEDARKDFATIEADGQAALEEACQTIMPQGASWLVLDGAQLPGTRYVTLPADADPVGEHGPLVAQPVAGGTLVELPEAVPLCARALVPVDAWAAPSSHGATASKTDDGGATLENAMIRVNFAINGLITSIYDKVERREVLKPGATANKLELFEDRPVSWDAWDIDIFFEDRGELLDGLTRFEVLETGPLRAVIEIHRPFRRSELTQRIVLHRASQRIDFETVVDWHESHLLLKAAFPVAVCASRAKFDIQWGQIDRPTHRNTSWDAAQFEVPAQKWADLSEGDYGVALLNDCKYGYDVRDDVLRLSLIKSATMPDTTADQGLHRFTYSLLPHAGDTRVKVRAEAYGLNYPPRVVAANPDTPASKAPPMVAVCESSRAIIETIKPACDGDGVIVRLFEAHNTRGPVRLRLAPHIARVDEVELLETGGTPLTMGEGWVDVALSPYQIKTLRLRTA